MKTKNYENHFKELFLTAISEAKMKIISALILSFVLFNCTNSDDSENTQALEQAITANWTGTYTDTIETVTINPNVLIQILSNKTFLIEERSNFAGYGPEYVDRLTARTLGTWRISKNNWIAKSISCYEQIKISDPIVQVFCEPEISIPINITGNTWNFNNVIALTKQ